MARPDKIDETWMPDAASLMVRSGISLKEAITQLDVALTTLECDNVLRRRSFQRLLWTERHRLNKEIASDPDRTKNATIGQMQLLAQKLMDEGAFDKAAEVLFKLARLENWVGEGGVVNVFAGLSQRDIDEMREKLEAGEKKKSVN